MSSQSVEKKVIVFPCYNAYKEDSINFNEIVIPFSNVGKPKVSMYIYKGGENIEFNERHPIFQKLLLDEFAELL